MIHRFVHSIATGLIACLGTIGGGRVQAAPIAYEGFAYPADVPLNSRSGGTGWQVGGTWVGGAANLVGTPGIAFPGLVTAGNAAQAKGSPITRALTSLGFSALRANGRFGRDGTEIWVSFLARRETNFLSGEFGGVSLLAGSVPMLLIGSPVGASTWGFQVPALGGNPAPVFLATDRPIVTGETTLLVVRLVFGADGIRDRVELFVNPPIEAPPAVADAANLGANLSFDQVRLQCGPTARPAMTFDELRIGETYADVVPVSAATAVGCLRAGPLRVTAGAELTLPVRIASPAGAASLPEPVVAIADPGVLPAERVVLDGVGGDRRLRLSPPAGLGGSTTVAVTVTPPGGPPASVSLPVEVVPAPGGLIAYEGFDAGPAGSSLAGKGSGDGFVGPWIAGVESAVGAAGLTLSSTSLSYSGLRDSGFSARDTVGGTAGFRRPLRDPFGEDGSVRYASVLVRQDGTQVPGASFGMRWLGSAGNGLLCGRPAAGAPQNFVLEELGTGRQADSGRSVIPDRATLLVLRFDFRPGADRVRLFVDPPIGAAEPPVADAELSGLDLGTDVTPALAGVARWSVDELRIGATFASVTPSGGHSGFLLKTPESRSIPEQVPYVFRVETVDPLPAGVTLRFELVGETHGASVDPATGEFRWVTGELDEVAPRHFTVRATSSDVPPLVREVGFDLTVVEGNLPPRLGEVPLQVAVEGRPFAVKLNATDPDRPAQPLQFTLAAGPPGMTVSLDGWVRWTPSFTQADRRYTVDVRVYDSFSASDQRTFEVAVPRRPSVVARWIGPVGGDWMVASNWDIGRTPTNSVAEVFDVVFEGRTAAAHLGARVVVRSLALRGGALLELPAATDELTVEGPLDWRDGTVLGNGHLTLGGRQTVRADPVGTLRLQGGVRLTLADFGVLESPVLCDGNVAVEVPRKAVLALTDRGGFLRVSGVPQVVNDGAVRLWTCPDFVPFVQLRNRGEFVVHGNRVAFDSGAPVDLIATGAGRVVLGAGDDLPGRIDGTVTFDEGASLTGLGWVRSAQIAGLARGQIEFGHVNFGASAITTIGLGSRSDRFVVADPVVLAGRLRLEVARGQAITPGSRYELIRSTGPITGGFDAMPFGGRVGVPGFPGSFLLTRSADGTSVAIENYLPDPVALASVPLVHGLPDGPATPGGCFVVPHPAIQLPGLDWTTTRIEIAIEKGFDPQRDGLELRENPAFAGEELLTIEGLLGGEQAILRRGKVLGAIIIKPGIVTAELNAQADREAVVGLLGRIAFRSKDLTADWYTADGLHYPAHSIAVRVTDGMGGSWSAVREVVFPELLRIESEPVVDLYYEREALLILTGVFSNGQRMPVRQLTATWTDGGCGVLAPPDPQTPGERRTVRVGPGTIFCCGVRATAGTLRAEMRVQAGDMVIGHPGGLLEVMESMWCYKHSFTEEKCPKERCPVYASFLNNYEVPDCQPAARVGAARHDAVSGAVPPSPTTFYALRDWMRRSEEGRRLVELYRTHTHEVLVLFAAHPTLLVRAQRLIAGFHPGLQALLAGRGDDVVVTEAMVSEVNGLWDDLIQYATPSLRTVMLTERLRLGGFRPFVGGTLADWAGLLGMSAPLRAHFHIVATQSIEGGLRFVSNDLPGLELFLWRSTDLRQWERVTNAIVDRDGSTLIATDPTPPAEMAFYRVGGVTPGW